MDPDSNIREQLAIAEEINNIRDGVDELTGRFTVAELDDLADKALRLAELVEALNTWICRGGPLPLGWVKGIKRTAR
jgi:hypothetical protein